MQSHSRRRGFTLIELLLVMLVIGILASMAVARYRALKERAYIATMKSDMGELRIAEEAFWAENQFYTIDLTLLDFKPSSDVTLTITSGDLTAGYDAQAVHIAAPAIICQMYVGRVVGAMPSGQIDCH
jgi:type IV pilus assembly protein PilA